MEQITCCEQQLAGGGSEGGCTNCSTQSEGGGGRDLLRRRREWRGFRAEPLTPPLIMGHQDGGHPVVGAGGQVCEEATKDLPNVWNLWNVQNFVWMKVRVFCAH